jgi:hypothetical protein
MPNTHEATLKEERDIVELLMIFADWAIYVANCEAGGDAKYGWEQMRDIAKELARSLLGETK